MKSNKFKIGELIELYNVKNSEDNNYPFYGININKEFMPSVANTTNVDRKKYKVVEKNVFVFSGMQTGRDNCIRIGMYEGNDKILVSPAYTTFVVTSPHILPTYFFMVFRSKEKDRYGAFLSDSSVRSNLDWDVFCDIELEVPDIEIQKKYVAIYEGLLANLHSYEKGLDDLKLVCDAMIDELGKKQSETKIGKYIESSDDKNGNLYKSDSVRGISIEKKFIPTKADMNGVSVSNYKVVKPNYFAYVPVTSRNGDKITIALNTSDNTYLVSSAYTVFKVADDEHLLPDYLMLYFHRSEFDRYARFNSWGSARETFDWENMLDVTIPLPDIDIQQDIVNIFNGYLSRKRNVENLKTRISTICPILIKGSIEEARRSWNGKII